MILYEALKLDPDQGLSQAMLGPLLHGGLMRTPSIRAAHSEVIWECERFGEELKRPYPP